MDGIEVGEKPSEDESGRVTVTVPDDWEKAEASEVTRLPLAQLMKHNLENL